MIASPARAQDAFAIFKTLCIDTQARQEAALSSADRLGWGVMNGDIFDELVAVSDIERAQGRIVQTTDAVLVVLTGLQTDNDPNTPTDVCVVHVFGEHLAFDAVTAAQNWVGVPPTEQMGSASRWEFVIVDGNAVSPNEAPRAQMLFGLIAYSDRERIQFEIARTRYQ